MKIRGRLFNNVQARLLGGLFLGGGLLLFQSGTNSDGLFTSHVSSYLGSDTCIALCTIST